MYEINFRLWIISLSAVLVATSACAPTQQWLEPRVCDCSDEVEQARSDAETPPAEIAGAVVVHQVDSAHSRAANQERQAARQLDDNAQDDPYLDREALAEQPVNPVVDDSRTTVEDDERTDLEDRYDLQFTEDDGLFRSNFTAGESSSLIVHRPGDTLGVYDDGQLVSSLDLGDYDRHPVNREVTNYPSGPVDLVGDGTDELMLVHRTSDADGSVTYHLTVYKLFASRVGTIFDKPIATSSEGEGLTQHADLRFLHGLDHRIIEWIPLDDDGEMEGDPIRYEWNRWEGVYRVPGPPPTAPERPRS